MTDEEIQTYLGQEIAPFKNACLDSSLFCAQLNEEIYGRIKRKEIVDWLWSQAINKKITIWVSVITLVEVHKYKRRIDGDTEMVVGPLYDAFLKQIEEGRQAGYVKVMEVNQTSARDAHRLCCELDITPNDAIILANALKFKCDVLLAWDNKLVGKTHKDIRIEEPFIYERDMFNGQIEIATIEEQEAYDKAHPKETVITVEPIEPDFRGSDGDNPSGEAAEITATDSKLFEEPETEAIPTKTAREEIAASVGTKTET